MPGLRKCCASASLSSTSISEYGCCLFNVSVYKFTHVCQQASIRCVYFFLELLHWDNLRICSTPNAACINGTPIHAHNIVYFSHAHSTPKVLYSMYGITYIFVIGNYTTALSCSNNFRTPKRTHPRPIVPTCLSPCQLPNACGASSITKCPCELRKRSISVDIVVDVRR